MKFSKSSIYSRRHLFEFSLILLFSLVLLNPLEISLAAFYNNFTPEMVKETILGLGSLAPVFMIFLEFLQVLIAPLPPVTMVASGYAFGVFPGAIYSFIGMTLGSAGAILLSRRYGQPLVARFISRAHVNRFHDLTEKHGLIVFTAFFIAPGFPHDLLCYIAGLTDLDTRKLIASVSLGRIPTLIALVMAGDSISSSRPGFAFLILALLIITGFIAVKNEGRLVKTAKNFERYVEEKL